MYRRLKNILGVSLMVLAVVVSQIPMPETRAEIAREMTEADWRVDDASARVVTFSMNGGTFKGSYNGYGFQNKTPVLVIDDGEVISSFPDNKFASYPGYKTEADTWYTDQECLVAYDTSNPVTESMTLYKKWYNVTSDGTKLEAKGFHISADGNVLYRYDGEEALVEIPSTVTVIAEGAFDDPDGKIRGITLPANIKKIEENAFRNISKIVYIYDSDTAVSEEYGKKLADEYEHLVYSGYLDPEKTEKIVGIQLLSNDASEEGSETPEGDRVATGETDSSTKPSNGGDSLGATENTESSDDESSADSAEENSKSSDSSPESSGDEESSKSPDSSPESSGDEENSKTPESSTSGNSEIVIDPDEKYIVTFDTGISGVSGEKREVPKGKTTSEEVSVDGKTARILRIGSDQIRRSEGGQEVTYTFRGWFQDNECTVRWNFGSDVIDRDTTIYAKWDRVTTEKTERTNTVVFQMNGGGFTGTYQGTSYTDAASLTTKIADGKGISSSEYPGSNSSASFRYSNYSTDSGWYKDKECLEEYAQKDSSGNDTVVKENVTLYKKWYHTSSGFTMNASDSVLYKYSGSVENVTIPNTVTVIGSDAFASVGGISRITLPDNISEVKENAFSGVNKVSKDITITGNTEKAQKVAKELANQYTRLVYEGGDASQDDDSVVVSRTASGSIKLGATLSGSTGTVGNSTATTATNNTSTTGTIVLGVNGEGATATASTQTTTVPQPAAGSQSAAASQNTAAPVQQDTAGSTVSATQEARTTQRQNATSASAPKSTQHIKDSTPKTGDPLQYRMLIVCAMFSVGVLLVLTGNGKKKRFFAS